MSYKLFLLLIILGTIISWVGWGMTIFYFNPEEISFLGFSVFYLSLFLALSGTIFLTSDWLKSKVFKKQLLFNRLKVSIRHSIFFAVLLLGWAFLKSQEILRWWNLLMFILILIVLEFFFMSYQRRTIYERQN